MCMNISMNKFKNIIRWTEIGVYYVQIIYVINEDKTVTCEVNGDGYTDNYYSRNDIEYMYNDLCQKKGFSDKKFVDMLDFCNILAELNEMIEKKYRIGIISYVSALKNLFEFHETSDILKYENYMTKLAGIVSKLNQDIVDLKIENGL